MLECRTSNLIYKQLYDHYDTLESLYHLNVRWKIITFYLFFKNNLSESCLIVMKKGQAFDRTLNQNVITSWDKARLPCFIIRKNEWFSGAPRPIVILPGKYTSSSIGTWTGIMHVLNLIWHPRDNLYMQKVGFQCWSCNKIECFIVNSDFPCSVLIRYCGTQPTSSILASSTPFSERKQSLFFI